MANTPVLVPGPATVITRRQQPITYVQGAKQVIPLSRNLFTRGLLLRLTETPTVTAANNTVANTQYGDEWASVAKVEVFANSATLLFSAAGSDLKPLTRIMAGHQPRMQTNLGDAQTANPVLDSSIYIPFINPRSRRPLDTILFAGELSDFRLEVTFAADVTGGTSVNSAATGWTAQPLLEVYTREQSAPINPATGQIALPLFFRRVLKTPIVFAAANADFPQKLNTGPIYRGLILNQFNAGADTTANIVNIKVENGATTFLDESYNSLQAYKNQENDIDELQFMFGQTNLLNDTSGTATNGQTIVDVGAAFNQATLNQNFANVVAAINRQQWLQSPGMVSNKGNPLSWCYVDFCDQEAKGVNGYMSEALDTQALGDTFLHLNVAGAGTVNVFTQELVRIPR